MNTGLVWYVPFEDVWFVKVKYLWLVVKLIGKNFGELWTGNHVGLSWQRIFIPGAPIRNKCKIKNCIQKKCIQKKLYSNRKEALINFPLFAWAPTESLTVFESRPYTLHSTAEKTTHTVALLNEKSSW